MSYLRRDRKPKRKAAKRPLRSPSMQLDHIMCDDATKLNKYNVGWRDEAKDLTLWAKFVKWVRGWHG